MNTYKIGKRELHLRSFTFHQLSLTTTTKRIGHLQLSTDLLTATKQHVDYYQRKRGKRGKRGKRENINSHKISTDALLSIWMYLPAFQTMLPEK